MPKIVFFCHDSIENIRSMEYYGQDISALEALGYDVVVCNRYRDIPWRFDAIFVWWWTYALLPVLFARALRRPAIVAGVYNFRFDDRASGVDYFARPWRQRWLIAAATRLASANLFTSHREYEAVPPHFGLRHAYYSPCAVGDDYFQVRHRADPRTLLLNLAWSGRENLQRKGVWTILEAAAVLKQRGRKFELVLAGRPGDAFADLQDRIVELGIEDSARAIGEVTQEEKLALFARTRLYLQPSRFEGFGLATAEAAAAGCPVIVCDAGEVRHVIGDGGRYVTPGEPVELADAIEELLDDPAEVARLDAIAVERIRRLYSAEGKQAYFAEILSELGVPPAAKPLAPRSKLG